MCAGLVTIFLGVDILHCLYYLLEMNYNRNVEVGGDTPTSYLYIYIYIYYSAIAL